MRRALDVPESQADVVTYGRMIQRLGTSSAGADGSMVSIVQGHMNANKEASEQILETVLARHPDGQGSGQVRLLLRRLHGDV